MVKDLTRRFVALCIKNHEDVRNPTVRANYGALEGWVSILGNMLLFVVKLLLGLSVHSVALIADAIHTLSDSASSLVIIIGFKIAQKPSDEEHPFGHGRMEPVATLVVSVLLFVAGFELLQHSFASAFKPEVASAPLWVILVIIGAIIFKELMARFSYVLGDIIDSDTLKADALHHRTDAISTVLVVVSLVASRFGYANVDGIMGIFVSLIIFYSAYEVAKDAINPLLGEAPSRKTLKRIEQIAMSNPGVEGVHDVICHKYGQTSIISLHIEVSDKETPHRLHELSEDVEDAVVEEMNGMVVVHIDPVNRDHPRYREIEEVISRLVTEDEKISNFHELRIVGGPGDRCIAVFDIALDVGVDEAESKHIVHGFKARFKDVFPSMKCVIKAEPKFVYNL